MLSEAQKKMIIASISAQIKGIEAIYLFGSQASGKTHSESDVDIAILTLNKISADAAFLIKADLSMKLRKDIDLIDLRRANDVVAVQIIAYGQVLACFAPNETALFETTAFAKYAHLNEERRGIIEDIKKRGNVCGR